MHLLLSRLDSPITFVNGQTLIATVEEKAYLNSQLYEQKFLIC